MSRRSHRGQSPSVSSKEFEDRLVGCACNAGQLCSQCSPPNTYQANGRIDVVAPIRNTPEAVVLHCRPIRVVEHKATTPDREVSRAFCRELRSASDCTADRDRQAFVAHVGAEAKSLASAQLGIDPKSATHELTRIAQSPIDMLAAYIVGVHDTYTDTCAAHARAMAQGATPEQADRTAGVRLHDKVWCTNGVRTLPSGKARLNQGRIGVPWHISKRGSETDYLVGVKRTRNTLECQGKPSKRAKADAQQRTRRAQELAVKRSEVGSNLERIRLVARRLASAIVTGSGLSRDEKRCHRARLFNLCKTEGLDAKRTLNAAIAEVTAVL